MDAVSGFINLLGDLFWVYLFILLGIVWRFSPLYKKSYATYITKIIISVFFPISIISSFANVETFGGIIILQIAIISILVHLGGYYFFLFLSREEGYTPDNGAIALTVTFPNALLFPFPIILAILGNDAIFYAALFVFFAMVIRNTFGMYIGARFSNNVQGEKETGSQGEFQLKKLLIYVFKFPPFLAVIVGFLLHILVGPEVIGSFPGLDIWKSIALYGSLLLVGVSFRDLSDLHPQKLFSKNTVRVSGIRFVVAPFFALIAVILFNLEPIVAIPILIQSMAPPAVSNIVYGTFFKLNESLMSSVITIVTLLALVVLPFELLLFLTLFPM
ncbi:MAG: AEC family transporter [Candidatus Hodarchaeales archaeon]|jgi:predicted permease